MSVRLTKRIKFIIIRQEEKMLNSTHGLKELIGILFFKKKYLLLGFQS
jgi:hypothetical protein